jgi:hypothetical protein
LDLFKPIMKQKRVKCYFMISIILTFIVISDSCSKDRGRYELFPLRVGNEYYYQYSYSFDDFLVGNSTIGNEKWTVLTDSEKNKNVEYFVEKKLNAIHIDWSILATNSHSDTTIIKDSIGYFIITENPKGDLLFFEITIPRYSNKPDSIIQIYGSSHDYYKTFYFSAGRALTRYYKFWGVMGPRIRESYIQDSIKIAN